MENKDTICPVCAEHSFESPNDYDICPICRWENDGVQRRDKDFWGGANSLSANEAKLVYILSQDEATKSKVSYILNNYQLRQAEINNQYRDIDHRTSKGKECYEAFKQAHNNFIIALEKLKIGKS